MFNVLKRWRHDWTRHGKSIQSKLSDWFLWMIIIFHDGSLNHTLNYKSFPSPPFGLRRMQGRTPDNCFSPVRVSLGGHSTHPATHCAVSQPIWVMSVVTWTELLAAFSPRTQPVGFVEKHNKNVGIASFSSCLFNATLAKTHYWSRAKLITNLSQTTNNTSYP